MHWLAILDVVLRGMIAGVHLGLATVMHSATALTTAASMLHTSAMPQVITCNAIECGLSPEYF